MAQTKRNEPVLWEPGGALRLRCKGLASLRGEARQGSRRNFAQARVVAGQVAKWLRRWTARRRHRNNLRKHLAGRVNQASDGGPFGRTSCWASQMISHPTTENAMSPFTRRVAEFALGLARPSAGMRQFDGLADECRGWRVLGFTGRPKFGIDVACTVGLGSTRSGAAGAWTRSRLALRSCVACPKDPTARNLSSTSSTR